MRVERFSRRLREGGRSESGTSRHLVVDGVLMSEIAVEHLNAEAIAVVYKVGPEPIQAASSGRIDRACPSSPSLEKQQRGTHVR